MLVHIKKIVPTLSLRTIVYSQIRSLLPYSFYIPRSEHCARVGGAVNGRVLLLSGALE